MSLDGSYWVGSVVKKQLALQQHRVCVLWALVDSSVWMVYSGNWLVLWLRSN